MKALVLRRHSGICALSSFRVNDVPGEPDKVHINLQWSSSALYNSVKSWVDRTFAGITIPRGGEIRYYQALLMRIVTALLVASLRVQ